jgi:hypothetical protein
MIVQVCNHYDGGENSVLIDDRSKPAAKVNRPINLKAISAPDTTHLTRI